MLYFSLRASIYNVSSTVTSKPWLSAYWTKIPQQPQLCDLKIVIGAFFEADEGREEGHETSRRAISKKEKIINGLRCFIFLVFIHLILTSSDHARRCRS